MTTAQPKPTLNRPDELVFVPLGGVGEIGMNTALYGYQGKWIMVDLGVTFGDDTTPGIDILMCDPAFIAERRDSLIGLVVTHAHEDHIGAIPHLWPQLRCPIYATPFTATMIRLKLAEAGLLNQVQLHEIPLSGSLNLGPFAIEYVTVTHSIPEPNSLVIKTAAGTVLHTGDWKFDPEPTIGPTADFEALKRIGDAGIDVMIGDSTNAMREGIAGSEGDVRRSLIDLVGRYDGKGRIAIACFASNVARVKSVALAAEAHGRSVALVGRSLWRIEQAARENGYMDDMPSFLREADAMELPRDKVLILCTGSQGEPRAALTRIAAGEHPKVRLDDGDVAIFSSRVIPGNERAIGRLQNALVGRGVEVVTERDHFIHVSGHPARDELRRMMGLVRPKALVPVHGETRHMLAHAQLAEGECAIPDTVVIGDGDMVRLAPAPVAVIDHVDTGRLGLEGKNLVPLGNGAFRARLRLAFSGATVATVVLDRQGKLAARPQVTLQGLMEDESEELHEELIAAVEQTVRSLAPDLRGDDEAVREAVRLAVRRNVSAKSGKKPMSDVHVVRV